LAEMRTAFLNSRTTQDRLRVVWTDEMHCTADARVHMTSPLKNALFRSVRFYCDVVFED